MASSARNAMCREKKRGMVRTALGICQEEGISKLWQGISPSLARHVVYSGVRLSIYEKLREIVTSTPTRIASNTRLKENEQKGSNRKNMSLYHRVICGMTSGAIGQFCASPADLVKVKMQTFGRRHIIEAAKTNVEASKTSPNMIQVLLEVIKKGGPLSLWKGNLV